MSDDLCVKRKGETIMSIVDCCTNDDQIKIHVSTSCHVSHFFPVRVTHDEPSKKRVLNRTFALLNMSSFKETMMNWERNEIRIVMHETHTVKYL